MQATTIRQATEIAQDVLQRGLSYRLAGARQGISRSTAERQFKALVRLAAEQTAIGRLRDLDLGSLALLRAARDDALRAVQEYVPRAGCRLEKGISVLDLDLAARRVRIQSGNPARDVALLLLSISTGARTLEIARLRIDDYIDGGGGVRDRSEFTSQRALLPLAIEDARLLVALDAYLDDRRRRGLGVTNQADFRGLRADSMLFLTRDGRPFEIKSRTPGHARPVCPVLGAVLRRIFAWAGLTGMTTNAARRHLARRLVISGATDAQVCEALGIAHQRSVRRLLRQVTPSREPLRVDLG